MILLDEPSAGLGAAETEHFGNILAEVVANRGVGMLLVEHDMSLVHQVCDKVWVLDFGRLIFDGTAAEMLNSEVVKAAYLGSELRISPVAAGEAPPSERAMTATLQLESITAGYGPTTVLWDIDLEVPANSVVALLGRTARARPPCCAWRAGSSRPNKAGSCSTAST